MAGIHRQFPAAAEYLSGIYILRRDYGEAGNRRLSEWLGVSEPAVTQALGRLKRLRLVRQKPYGDIALTPTGRLLAVQVLRRHYLLEHLLVRMLEYPWEKADEEAKVLQSLISQDLTEHLFRSLGSPKACPHGNPMPGSPAEGRLVAAARLTDAPVGKAVRILRITEEGEQVPSLLNACGSRGVWPGARFVVRARDAESLSLVADGRARHQDHGANRPKDRRTGPAVVRLPLSMARHVRYEPSSRGKLNPR